MRAHIDITEVEARTKIRARYLRAIENEEFDLLPGTVYVKSFLRTYADFLGLDSRLLLDEFKRRYERPDEYEARSLAATARERERGRSRAGRARTATGRSARTPKMLIALSVLVIIAALYVIGSHGGGGNPSVSAGVTPSQGRRASSHGGHAHGHNGSDGHGTGSGHVSGGGGAGRHGRTHHSGGTRGATIGGKTTTSGTTTTPTPMNATIAVKPTGPVWVCVADSTGKVVVQQTYDVGQTVPLESSSALAVTLGNANAELTIDGKPYPLTRSPHVIGLRITPNKVQASTTPQCT